MTPPEVSAWALWLLAAGVLALIWAWGSAAIDAMERRQRRRLHTHDVVLDPEQQAWERIVRHEEGR